jgi:hypothetical protein
MTSPDVYIHPRALVESDAIGPGTRIWANTHIMKGVRIGRDCNICDGAFLETGVEVGRGVTIKQNVILCEGVTVGDGVFLGPNVVFTNDLYPRSPRLPLAAPRYADKSWLTATASNPAPPWAPTPPSSAASPSARGPWSRRARWSCTTSNPTRSTPANQVARWAISAPAPNDFCWTMEKPPARPAAERMS